MEYLYELHTVPTPPPYQDPPVEPVGDPPIQDPPAPGGPGPDPQAHAQ